MRLTRRQALAGAATGALGAAGIYELVDRLAGSPAERTATDTHPPRAEQHVLGGIEIVEVDGVEVVVPPLHHEVVTARVTADTNRKALRQAQAELEHVLAGLERRFPANPAGLGLAVVWGRPYFDRYVPGLARRHLPIDRRASTTKRRTVSVLLDAIRFPSDPQDVLLEQNDLAVHLRSDSRDHVDAARKAIFGGALDGILKPTSIRKGFVGGGFGGRQSLPKQMAMAAGVPGADLIPETAQLFLGFTSTQKAALGPPQIVNFETLGFVDLRGGYFSHGTTMHVSHLFEDLEAWYLNFDFRERVDTAFRPGQPARPDQQTLRQAPEDVSSEARVESTYRRDGAIGHSAAIQTASRLRADHVAEDGTVYAKGTAIPQRVDFNTLDNPFFWSAEPKRDGMASTPQAGIHFAVFHPTSDDFHRSRLAMDGVLPDGTHLRFPPRARGQGFNSVLRATHRQNFLVPPRAHRSFPLAELL
ncbi:MAG TPA: hypothetical protein VF101_05205 [Gaiellaceae bacterium]